jgi:hypothetical protein
MSKVERLYPGVIGMELKSDAPAVTTIRDGNENSPENLAQARLQFPEMPRKDFEPLGRRRWRDRGSGIEYRVFPGACLLSLGAATQGVIGFFQDGDRLIFLQRLDMPMAVSVGMTGPLRTGRVEADGRITWDGAA